MLWAVARSNSNAGLAADKREKRWGEVPGRASQSVSLELDSFRDNFSVDWQFERDLQVASKHESPHALGDPTHLSLGPSCLAGVAKRHVFNCDAPEMKRAMRNGS